MYEDKGGGETHKLWQSRKTKYARKSKKNQEMKPKKLKKKTSRIYKLKK